MLWFTLARQADHILAGLAYHMLHEFLATHHHSHKLKTSGPKGSPKAKTPYPYY